jgi:uncharacterized protein YjiS (DUF1127 family)
MSTLDPHLSEAAPLREFLNALLAPSEGWSSRARRIADLLVVWHERARQRRELQRLNDRMLRDIGLTRADVMAESSKPFWRL